MLTQVERSIRETLTTTIHKRGGHKGERLDFTLRQSSAPLAAALAWLTVCCSRTPIQASCDSNDVAARLLRRSTYVGLEAGVKSLRAVHPPEAKTRMESESGSA